VIKTKSAVGLMPILKADDPDIIINYSLDNVTKNYVITAELKSFEYQIENISNVAVTISNTNPNNSKENLVPTVIEAKTKTNVKTNYSSGLNSLILKTVDATKITEYTDSLKKKYYINAYNYMLEYKISGDVEPITIIYTNEKSINDTLKNVVLPYALQFKTFTANQCNVFVAKNNVGGILKIELFVKDKSVSIASINEAFGSILSIYDIKAKTTKTTKKSPSEYKCGSYNGNSTITGEKGGCYYINSNGNKTYVDHSYCNCK
jgi:hypothetical protein